LASCHCSRSDNATWPLPAKAKTVFKLTRELLEEYDPKMLERAERQLVTNMLVEARGLIGRINPARWTSTAKAKSQDAFKSAFELFKTLHDQQDTFGVEMLPVRCPNGEISTFDSQQMRTVKSGLEDYDLQGAELAASVFPKITRVHTEDDEDVSKDLMID
jgi:Zn-dependent oligopeptidase